MTKCLRTNRRCDGGAYDGKDGLGIDCPVINNKDCVYKYEKTRTCKGCVKEYDLFNLHKEISCGQCPRI